MSNQPFEEDYPKPLAKFLLETYGLLVTDMEAALILNNTAQTPDITTPQPTDNSFEEVRESILNKYQRIGYLGKAGGQLAGYNEYDVEKMMQEYAQKTTSLERDIIAGEAWDACLNYNSYWDAIEAGQQVDPEYMPPPDKETYLSNLNNK